MEPKKISFGFSKIAKKPTLLNNKQTVKAENKVELIKCLEGHEIKLVEEKPEAALLVIPMKENQKTSTALASLLKRRAVLLGEEEVAVTEAAAENAVAKIVGADSLEQRAARELIAELQANNAATPSSDLVLPVLKPDELPLDGAKEPTLDDYDNIPVQEYGLAMLRGMGWVEPPKQQGGAKLIDEAPLIRPKGMGLGADKALKPKPLLVPPEANEVLEIKKQAYVRILGGKHKDLYGQIEGFDDHAGRVIVKLAIGGTKEAFNEFLCQPVSRKEYAQYGKCINTAKYEEYKKLENENGQIILQKEDEHTKKSIKKEDELSRHSSKAVYTEMEYKESKLKRENYNYKEYKLKPEDYSEYKSKNENKAYKSRLEDYKESKPKKEEKYDKAAGKLNGSEHDELKIKLENHSDRAATSSSTSRNRYDKEEERKADKYRSSRSSSRRRRHRNSSHSPAGRALTTTDDDDTCASSSDTDSAYERSKHKKAAKSHKSKRKSKKSKSKTRHRRRENNSVSETEESDAGSGSGTEDVRRERDRHKSHKKKTKKSKKPRSRDRSRSRSKGRR